MNESMIHDLGCVDVTGADVFGGEMINPYLLGIAIGITVTVSATIINNWSTMKASFAQGFQDGVNGRI